VGVLALWRYPVKAMLGERLAAVHLDAHGPRGDRAFLVVDVRTGARIASKRGDSDPRLRACRAALTGDGELVVTFPDGTTATGPAAVAATLSELLGRAVRLERGHHPDHGAVHLVTTRTLAHLGGADPRRLRPNLVLDDGAAPGAFTEDALLGTTLTGPTGARLAVDLPTPRCVVVARATEELPTDRALLRTIAREHRVDVGPYGRFACAGAYASVAAPGRLAVGDRLG